jgi:hypothetical protein
MLVEPKDLLNTDPPTTTDLPNFSIPHEENERYGIETFLDDGIRFGLNLHNTCIRY